MPAGGPVGTPPARVRAFSPYWEPVAPATEQLVERTGPAGPEIEDADRWLKVGEAAKVVDVNPGVITRAVDEGELLSNGKRERDRRICAISLARWHLKRSTRAEADESDDAVTKKMEKHTRG